MGATFIFSWRTGIWYAILPPKAVNRVAEDAGERAAPPYDRLPKRDKSLRLRPPRRKTTRPSLPWQLPVLERVETPVSEQLRELKE